MLQSPHYLQLSVLQKEQRMILFNTSKQQKLIEFEAYFETLILKNFFDSHQLTSFTEFSLVDYSKTSIANYFGVCVSHFLSSIRSLSRGRHNCGNFASIFTCTMKITEKRANQVSKAKTERGFLSHKCFHSPNDGFKEVLSAKEVVRGLPLILQFY